MKLLRLHLLLLVLLIMAAPARAEAPPPKVTPDLYSVIWQQTSAEYKALCLQTWEAARQALGDQVRTGSYRSEGGRLWLETLVRQGNGKLSWDRRPLAIILDLDETVLDNSGYQAWLLQSGEGFTLPTWDQWLQFQAAVPAGQKALPGAVEFLRDVKAMGITPMFLTNRAESGRAATLALLKGLGLETPSDQLLMEQPDEVEAKATQDLLKALNLAPDSPAGLRLTANDSDKERRRVEIQTRYHVVGWFGDNLYDFPVDVRTGTPAGADILAARDRTVTEHPTYWGNRWFVLPNPMYGSWIQSSTIPKAARFDVLQDWGFGAWRKSH